MTAADPPDPLIGGILRDLAHGRLLDLAELYAVGALGSAGELTVDEHLRSAPATLRTRFADRVAQTREALSLTYGSLNADPPSDLLRKILERLPPTHPGP